MIGRLRGILAAKQPPYLMVDVHGVGYEVEAPLSTFERLPAVGEEVMLHTHMVVREDGHSLCGFATPGERELFRQLIRVNGVGARLAVAILSGAGADDLRRWVQAGDVKALTRLPGVGRKTAERLIMELRDRLGRAGDGAMAPAGDGAALPADPVGEAVEALVALGYKPREASRLVGNVAAHGGDSEALIRRALRSTVK